MPQNLVFGFLQIGLYLKTLLLKHCYCSRGNLILAQQCSTMVLRYRKAIARQGPINSEFIATWGVSNSVARPHRSHQGMN